MSRASTLSGFTTAIGQPTDLNVGVVTATRIDAENITASNTYEFTNLSITGIATVGDSISIGSTLVGVTTINSSGINSPLGVSTLSNVVIGGATTEMVVTGDTRITGILTVGTGSVTIDGTSGNSSITGVTTVGITSAYITSINDLNYPTAGPLSNRNLIINGAMQVAQRATEVTGVADNSDEGYQTLDRFGIAFANSPAGTCSIGQSTTVPSNQGFSNSYKLEVTTANASPTSILEIYPYTRLEAQDVRNSGWNYTDSNSYLTLSFWARSNKAGTYVVTIQVPDGTAQRLPLEYTLVADEWTPVVLQIPGNSNLTIDNDNGIGLDIQWKLLQGSDRNQGTNGVWSSDLTHRGTTNGVNLFDTVGNELYLTGVQLEVGSKATPFEHRSYGQELALCQRYYQILRRNPGVVGMRVGVGQATNSNQVDIVIPFPTTMRVAPTALEQSGTAGDYGLINATGSGGDCSSIPAFRFASIDAIVVRFTDAGHVSAGNASQGYLDQPEAFLAWSAEL